MKPALKEGKIRNVNQKTEKLQAEEKRARQQRSRRVDLVCQPTSLSFPSEAFHDRAIKRSYALTSTTRLKKVLLPLPRAT